MISSFKISESGEDERSREESLAVFSRFRFVFLGYYTIPPATQATQRGESLCVKHALQGFTHFLEGQCVKWYTDNKGVVTIVKSGSNKVHLHKLAMEIFSLSKDHDIAIDMEWIPRSDNEVADYLSKFVDFDERGVKDSYFQTVNSIWGPFTVDCFANSVIA